MIETKVSKGIISTYFEKLEKNLNLSVEALRVLSLPTIWQKLG